MCDRSSFCESCPSLVPVLSQSCPNFACNLSSKKVKSLTKTKNPMIYKTLLVLAVKNALENISPHCAKVRLIIINVVFAGGSGSDNRYLVLAIYYVWGPQPGGPGAPECMGTLGFVRTKF